MHTAAILYSYVYIIMPIIRAQNRRQWKIFFSSHSFLVPTCTFYEYLQYPVMKQYAINFDCTPMILHAAGFFCAHNYIILQIYLQQSVINKVSLTVCKPYIDYYSSIKTPPN